VVSFDGKGVPMIKEEAAQLKAKLGTGEKRQQKLVAPLRRITQVSRLTHVVKERKVFPWPL
jgi:hypothetical protein